MGRNVTGYTEYRGGRWQVQARDPEGVRAWYDLPKSITADQSELAHAVGTRMAVSIRNGDFVPGEREETATEWYGRWIDARVARGIGDPVKYRGQFRKYVEPVIGHLPMRAVRREHAKTIVSKLDALAKEGSISWKTAINVFSCLVSKAFKDATDGKDAALCVLTENPVIGVRPPDKGAKTKKQYLYPDEAAKLFACADVPLWRRQLYAFAIYTYMRAGELAALRWEDVDVERGIITVHQALERRRVGGAVKSTKTDEERRVTVEVGLRALLRFMHEHRTSALVFPKMPPDHGSDGQAATLRADLERAGVTRAALLEKVRTRKRMTFHDLRATGITWAAIRGDDALKIMARSGHTEYQTLMAYVREAEVIREGFGTVFPELPEALRALPQDCPNGPENTPKSSIKQRPQGDSNPRRRREKPLSWTGLDDGDGKRAPLIPNGARTRKRNRASGRGRSAAAR